MTNILKHSSDHRKVALGLDRGVFFAPGKPGVAWNGLVSVDETPSGNASALYVDGMKVGSKETPDSFSGTIRAYTYPDEFEPYGGVTDQRKRPFSMSYRTKEINALGLETYTIHIVYNVLVAPAKSQYLTIDSSVTTTMFEWDFTTLPLRSGDIKGTSHLQIRSADSHNWTFEAIESILYGDDGTQPRLPTPSEVVSVIEENSLLRIIDHGDGSWTAIGPDEAIQMLDSDSFSITWPSAVYISDTTYEISSL